MNDEADNDHPTKRQRKQVHYELEDILEGSDDEDFESPAPVSFSRLT